MGVVHGLDADWVDLENDPLVRRLRALQWADVPSDVRTRCWERISNRMATLEDKAPVPPAAAVRGDGERYEYTRRRMAPRLAVAQGWSRRPMHVPALAHARPLLSA
jgi:hypothetical protein